MGELLILAFYDLDAGLEPSTLSGTGAPGYPGNASGATEMDAPLLKYSESILIDHEIGANPIAPNQ